MINNIEVSAVEFFKDQYEIEYDLQPRSANLQELRDELIELAQQAADLKLAAKSGTRSEVEKALLEKDLQALRDDVQYYQAELLEQSMKVKTLVIRNNEIAEQLATAKSKASEIQDKQQQDEVNNKSIELSIIEGDDNREFSQIMRQDSFEEPEKLNRDDVKQSTSSVEKLGGSKIDTPPEADAAKLNDKIEKIVQQYVDKEKLALSR